MNSFADTETPESTISLEKISLNLGYSLLSSRVTGSGFNFSHSHAKGSTASTQFQAKSNKMALTLVGGFSQSQNEVALPTSLSPDEINVRKEEVYLYGLTLPTLGSGLFSFKIGLGYKYQKYSADSSSPNWAITSLTSQGVLIALKKEIPPFWEISQGLDLDVQLYLPHRVHEASVSTGYNPNAWGVQAKATWRKNISDKTHFLFSPTYAYDVITFTGSGTRGTKSASDVRTNFNLPIGIEHLF